MNMIVDLRSLRKDAGLRQADLAEKLGITVRALARLEKGLEPIANDLRSKLIQVFKFASAADLDQHMRPMEFGEGYVTHRSDNNMILDRTSSIDVDKLPVLDLFCGIGGFSSGFEQTNRFQVVGGVDLLGDRLDTFRANHKSAVSFGGDIRNLSLEDIYQRCPAPHVVIGGPPCQGFSSIRPFRNVALHDPRNNLAEEFCRVVAGLNPEWLVFENVVGLLTHEKGRTFSALFEAFESLGYRVEARVLNAANFGVPQRRERLILVGNRRNKRFRWPEPTHHLAGRRGMAGKHPKLSRPLSIHSDIPPAITVADAIYDLPPLKSGERCDKYLRTEQQSYYARLMRDHATELTLHEATSHSEKMLEIIKHAGDNIFALPAGMVTSGFSSCYSRLSANEPSVTLTVNFVHPASNRCIHPVQDRALTPREGARLQSFRDTFEFRGSRAQTVKQIGNAVPPLLGNVIAQAILESD
jgi:DNA (cytosine-5)-methyltransferase 1